jgi:hypothetical protein
LIRAGFRRGNIIRYAGRAYAGIFFFKQVAGCVLAAKVNLTMQLNL